MDHGLRVELVRLYQFSLDGGLLCTFPAQEHTWQEIREGVVWELQQRGMRKVDAEKAWDRLRT